jgi:leucyl aminopeptidase
MLVSVAAILLSLLPSTVVATPIAGQTVLSPQFPQPAAHIVDQAILNAASAYDDPVAGLLSIRPELADVLSEPRLLRLLEGEQDVWASEGDKLRLRKQGKKFMDVTDHQHLLGDLKVSPPSE